MNFTGFTRKIWNLFGSKSDKRADYLWGLYLGAPTMRSESRRYLDIGCGSGENAIIFGEGSEEIHCVDVNGEGIKDCKRRFSVKGVKNISFYLGDAQALPFRNQTFDCVSMFSVIEHVAEQHFAIQEASRVLRGGGELILQVPNKYFFVDLHTGLPFLHYLPTTARRWLLTKLGYKELADIMNTRVPSKTELANLIRAEFAKVRVLKIVYPSDLIVPQLKPVYSALKGLGIFALVPFGFLFIASKAKSASLLGDAK